MVRFSKKKIKKNKHKNNTNLSKYKINKISKRKKYLNIPSHNISNKKKSKNLRLSTIKNHSIPKSKKIYIGGVDTNKIDITELQWNDLKSIYESSNDIISDNELNKLIVALFKKNTQLSSTKNITEQIYKRWGVDSNKKNSSFSIKNLQQRKTDMGKDDTEVAEEKEDTEERGEMKTEEMQTEEARAEPVNDDLYTWKLYNNKYIKSENKFILLGYFKIGTVNNNSYDYKILNEYCKSTKKEINYFTNVLAYNDMIGTHFVNKSEYIGNIKFNPTYNTHLIERGLIDKDGNPTDLGNICLNKKTMEIKDTKECKIYNTHKKTSEELAENNEYNHMALLKESDNGVEVNLTVFSLLNNQDQDKEQDQEQDQEQEDPKVEANIEELVKKAAEEAALVAANKYKNVNPLTQQPTKNNKKSQQELNTNLKKLKENVNRDKELLEKIQDAIKNMEKKSHKIPTDYKL